MPNTKASCSQVELITDGSFTQAAGGGAGEFSGGGSHQWPGQRQASGRPCCGTYNSSAMAAGAARRGRLRRRTQGQVTHAKA